MDYFAKPGMSFHKLKDFADYGPGYYYRKYISGEIQSPDKDSFRIGRLIHMAILEPERFNLVQMVPAEFLTPTGLMSTKKDARAWLAKVEGREWGTPGELETAKRLGIAVRGNEDAAKILADAVALEEETPPDLERDGIRVKGKADILTLDEVWDVKTITSLANIRDHCRDFHYPEQVVWYADLFDRRGGGLIFVEKDEPNRVQVVRFDDEIMTQARRQADAWWRDYCAAQASNSWPINPPSIVLTAADLAA